MISHGKQMLTFYRYRYSVLIVNDLGSRFVPTHLRIKRDDHHKKDGLKRKEEVPAMFAKPKVKLVTSTVFIIFYAWLIDGVQKN